MSVVEADFESHRSCCGQGDSLTDSIECGFREDLALQRGAVLDGRVQIGDQVGRACVGQSLAVRDRDGLGNAPIQDDFQGGIAVQATKKGRCIACCQQEGANIEHVQQVVLGKTSGELFDRHDFEDFTGIDVASSEQEVICVDVFRTMESRVQLWVVELDGDHLAGQCCVVAGAEAVGRIRRGDDKPVTSVSLVERQVADLCGLVVDNCWK